MPVLSFLQPGSNRWATLLFVLRCIKRQRKFLHANIQPVLDEALQNNDGSLDDSDIKKINQYYGLAVPAILGESFALLYGRKLSVKERLTLTCLGGMTGLFDDFFDKQYFSEEKIQSLIRESQPLTAGASNEKLFQFFYATALKNCTNPDNLQHSLEAVHKAQVLSKKQENGKLSADEILQITFEKGGESLRFYRSGFDQDVSTAGDKLFYELGGLMQLCNDIFDVYKDRESNIQTPVTTASAIGPVRKLLEAKLKQIHRQAIAAGFEKVNIAGFFGIANLGVFARAMVCLEQLEALEKTSAGRFDVKAYSRKQLICDMELWANRWKSLKYVKYLRFKA